MRQPYPFTSIVGQEQMKLALVLNAINPRIGGILIRGERGTAKSTAVRSLAALLPEHGVVVEHLPWSDGKRPQTTAMMGFLARWARRLSWRETAKVFQTSWEAVYRSVEWFVRWGLEHRELQGVESVGLDGREAGRVLAERTFSDAVDGDWSRARALGITGVPTFVIGDQGVVGAQPYETLERFVRAHGAQPR